MDQHGGISPHVPISSRAVTNKQRRVHLLNKEILKLYRELNNNFYKLKDSGNPFAFNGVR